MRTKVFAHKGFVGIESGIDAEGLLNNPLKPGQLGFVVRADCVDFQKEAIEILKTIKRSGDSIGEVDIYQSNNDGVILCWLGGPFKLIDPTTADGSNEYDASLITATEGVITSKEFSDAIDAALAEREIKSK